MAGISFSGDDLERTYCDLEWRTSLFASTEIKPVVHACWDAVSGKVVESGRLLVGSRWKGGLQAEPVFERRGWIQVDIAGG